MNPGKIQKLPQLIKCIHLFFYHDFFSTLRHKFCPNPSYYFIGGLNRETTVQTQPLTVDHLVFKMSFISGRMWKYLEGIHCDLLPVGTITTSSVYCIMSLNLFSLPQQAGWDIFLCIHRFNTPINAFDNLI